MVDWISLLSPWSEELLSTKLAALIELPPNSTNWLGFAGASDDDIAGLERRLGLELPPSYRTFLKITDGWRRTTPFIARIRPAAEVTFFRQENEQWVEVYQQLPAPRSKKQYFVYSDDGASDYRSKHLQSAIQISDVDDGVYLLNPEVVTPDGEWEAWFFANWIPGAKRFPSFAHLMLAEYRTFARLESIQKPGYVAGPSLEVFGPEVSRVRAKRRGKAAKPSPALENLIEQLASSDEALRSKAVKTICGKLRGRRNAARRPDLVQPLVQLFKTSSDTAVRATCVSLLTEIAEDDAPPESLLSALSDSDPGVILAGIFALTYFPNKRAIDPLCRFIESRVNALFNENAMSQLGSFGDERAVPTLSGVLLDTSNEFDQSFGTAALALARCSSAGVDALIAAQNHPDPRVRFAVVAGLDVSGDPRSDALLEQSLSDSDPKVRQRAAWRKGRFIGSGPPA
jgi:hypothetical protein